MKDKNLKKKKSFQKCVFNRSPVKKSSIVLIIERFT